MIVNGPTTLTATSWDGKDASELALRDKGIAIFKGLKAPPPSPSAAAK